VAGKALRDLAPGGAGLCFAATFPGLTPGARSMPPSGLPEIGASRTVRTAQPQPQPVDTNFAPRYPRVMKNVTITLDEEVARWARIEVAKRETSVSRFVGEMLREHMRSEDAYEAARRQFFAVEPRPLRKTDSRLPSRECEDMTERASGFLPQTGSESTGSHEGEVDPPETPPSTGAALPCPPASFPSAGECSPRRSR